MEPDARPRHVVVVGATAAGKSTLARRLAGRIEADFVELDALFWGSGWTPAEPHVFRARVAAATAGPTWVVAGNYGAGRNLLWPCADTIVRLDYTLPLVLGRLTTRTLRRAVTREVLWNGNRENVREHAMVWSDRSLFHWLFTTYWRYRRDLPRLFAEPRPNARILHLRSPRAAEAWLGGVT